MCRIVYIRKKKDKEEHAFFYFSEKRSMMLVSVQVCPCSASEDCCSKEEEAGYKALSDP
jgi:hypothetical protein